MKYTMILFSLIFLFAATLTASAQTVGWVYWQSNGGGCVPTDKTVKDQQYWTITGSGRVKYKGNGIQPLEFSCPVSNINSGIAGGDATVIKLFYQDPDGPGDAFKVEATLRSFSKKDGAYKAEVCKATSDKQGQWQLTVKACGAIDLSANIYWVEVVIKRTRSSKLVVEFNGVSIERVIQ